MSDSRPIIYLSAGEVIAFHSEIMRRAGQPLALLRDRGLLESAVQRPQNAAYYKEADVVTQAAQYMIGIALNHPFVDGNKRAGYVAGMAFLQVNGYVDLDASINDVQLGVWLEQVVNHEMTFEAFIHLLNEHLRERLIQP